MGLTAQERAQMDAVLKVSPSTAGGKLSPQERAQMDAVLTGTAPTTTQPTQTQPGGFQRFVQGVAKPFVNLATNLANVTEGTANLAGAGVQALAGNKEKSIELQNAASVAASKKRDFGYLGEGNAVGGDAPTGNAGADFLKATKQIFGTGLEVGSYAAPLGILGKSEQLAAKAALNAGKAVAKPSIAAIAKGGALAGGVGSTGAELARDGSTLGSVLGAGAIGTVAGGVLGSAIPGISRGVSKLGGVASKVTGSAVNTLPERMFNNIIRPTKNAFSFGKNPGRALADLGIIGNSIEELAPKISQSKNDIGSQIGDLVRSLGVNKNTSLGDVLSPLDEAITKAKGFKRTNKPLIARLEALRSDLVDSVGKNKKIDPQQVFAMKKAIGSMSKWTGQAFDAELNQARVGVYSKLKKILEDAANSIHGSGNENSRSLRRLNELYGNLLEAESAIENRIGVDQRNNMLSLPDIGAFGTGALVAGGPGALALLALKKITGSVAFKTRVASRLQAILSKMDGASKKVVDDILPGMLPVLEKMSPDEANKFIDSLPYITRMIRAGILSSSPQQATQEASQSEPQQTETTQ